MEVTNRFKGLDLVDRVPEELWMETHNTVQEAGTKTISKKRNIRWQGGYLKKLYNSQANKRSKRQGRKGKIYRTECRVPGISKERQEGLLKRTMERNKQ